MGVREEGEGLLKDVRREEAEQFLNDMEVLREVDEEGHEGVAFSG